MTRLTFADIESIDNELADYDAQLKRKTGHTLLEMACYANGCEARHVRKSQDLARLAVVPMTGGDGLIAGFGETVRGIVRHIGFHATVTRNPDAAGLAEAVEGGNTHMIAADDHRFFVLDFNKRLVFDNSEATGCGFTAGLDLMAKGLQGKNVLVIGCGPVGRSAAKKALKLQADVTVCDRDRELGLRAARRLSGESGKNVTVSDDLAYALSTQSLIVDASNAGGIIHARHIRPDSFIAAPGMPLGLTPAAREAIGGRLLHDPLQIGVATMVVNALRTPF